MVNKVLQLLPLSRLDITSNDLHDLVLVWPMCIVSRYWQSLLSLALLCLLNDNSLAWSQWGMGLWKKSLMCNYLKITYADIRIDTYGFGTGASIGKSDMGQPSPLNDCVLHREYGILITEVHVIWTLKQGMFLSRDFSLHITWKVCQL